ncbi:MAG: hypothetical protein OXD29_01535 [Roseovarius sp.]|nr:hypothetical protein [Roseovarius sp.]
MIPLARASRSRIEFGKHHIAEIKFGEAGFFGIMLSLRLEAPGSRHGAPTPGLFRFHASRRRSRSGRNQKKINCGTAEANKSPEGSGNPLESLVDLRLPAIIDQLPLSGNIRGAFVATADRIGQQRLPALSGMWQPQS